jgi:8-oxo-dGTP diphosphatase
MTGEIATGRRGNPAANYHRARRVGDIDWSRWRAVDTATLVFVRQGDELLLIDKKRGLGKGKVNAPGGKVDPGESVQQCAVRECREELGIEVAGIECLGEHRFQFVDGYSIHCFVFHTGTYSGEARETAEAAPRWTPIDAIPYHLMWEDDALWLPLLLRGQAFQGNWIFDDDRMVDHELILRDRIEVVARKPLAASTTD